MAGIFSYLGPWFWWIVAALLLLGELLAPGVFMIWLAGAAGLTAIAALVMPLGWQGEIGVFSALSVVLVLASWKWVMGQRQPQSDQPHLNRRMLDYVGKSYVLDQAIVNGAGKVRIDDTLWDVDGPDLPQGARVKIIGVKGLRLVGEMAD